MRPLVAVTTTIVPEAGPYQRPQIALYSIYVDVVERLALAALLVTPAHVLRSMPFLLDRCDGLILTGGEDLDPVWYGEEPIPGLGIVNSRRDRAEMAILRLALERRMPVLGICRGCQLLNVCFGGTLYQDLATQWPGAPVQHRQAETWERRTHLARVLPGSRLARIVESEEMRVNSFHHQAIKDLGKGLEVVALAEDGIIEAVESREYPWVIGIQWHPERHEAKAPETDPDRRLLSAFRDEVRAYARARFRPPSRRRAA